MATNKKKQRICETRPHNRVKGMAIGMVAVSLCVTAAEFPNAGGDIASDDATGWNGAKPGATEEAKFTKAGIYTASTDVTFGSVNFAADGLVFDLATGNKTVTLTDATPLAKGPALANMTTRLKGGVWSGKEMKIHGMGAGYTLWLSDGATITDTGTFYAGFGLSKSLVKLTDGAKINAANLRLHCWGNTESKLDVGPGCEVKLSGAYIGKTNDGAGYGGHTADFHGVGALLKTGGDLNTAQLSTDCGVCIRDAATLEVGGNTVINTANDYLDVLNGATATVKTVNFNSVNGRICVSNATFSAAKINIGVGTNAKSDGNRVVVRDGAEATVTDTFFIASNGRLLVSNATYTASANFQLGSTAAATGNVATVAGSKSVFGWKANVFGSGVGNRFELADGARWDIGGSNINLMDATSNNVLRVTGGAKLNNRADPVGDCNFYIYGTDNTLEILDGGEVDVERFFLMGTRSRVVVSNGTLKAWSSVGYGIWMRGSGSHELIVRGATPSVQLNELKPTTGSEIRIEVPAEGYAVGYVPVTVRVLNPYTTATEKFKIDCADWAANSAANERLVLLRQTNGDISAAHANWILAQNSDLPANVRLRVKGGDVVLSKPKGMVVIVK